MRSRLPFRALLLAALSSTVLAQAKTEPAIDTNKTRATAEAALRAEDFTAAAAAFKTLTDADPKDARSWQLLGYSLHAAGKLDEALPAHLKATEFPATAAIASYNVACVHSLQDRPDEAFAWLDKAVAAGFDDLAQLRKDADFDKIRADARFAKVEAAVKAKASAPRVQAFAQNVERRNARVAWFTRGGSPGQIAIDYSPVPWKDAFDEELASGKHKGEKWRLGADFWTRLDNSVDVQLGGVTVPAGYYYLTLEMRDENTFVLALHDAASVKKQKLDAFQAKQLKGGIEVTLAHATDAKAVDSLELNLKMNDGSKTDGTFTLAFGKHCLSAPFVAKIE